MVGGWARAGSWGKCIKGMHLRLGEVHERGSTLEGELEGVLDWLATEMHESKGIQEMINKSQQREDDQVIHHTWSSDIPFFHLYHTLVDDSIRAAFGKAYAVKTREELDGRNSFCSKVFMRRPPNISTTPVGYPTV